MNPTNEGSRQPTWRVALVKLGAMLAFLMGVLAIFPACLTGLVIAIDLFIVASTGDFHRAFPGAEEYPGGAVELFLLMGITSASAGTAVLGFKTRNWLNRPDGDERMKTAVATASLVFSMTVCALFGTIAINKFRGLTRMGSEGASRGNLGAIRSALSIYYGDTAGVYPSSLNSLTEGGKYLREIPMAIVPYYHRDSSKVTFGKVPDDSGGWVYDNDPKDKDFGLVFVNCTHTDTKGSSWNSY